jgi:hypothetical protein
LAVGDGGAVPTQHHRILCKHTERTRQTQTTR